MAPSTVLLSLAGLTIAAGVGVLQSPNLNDRTVTPVLASSLRAQTNKVSVQFRSAPLAEVLRWLNDNGYSFVVNDKDVESAKTITLNINNQPVNAVANSIAVALGGHWEETNGIHVFRKGVMSRNWMKVPSGSGYLWGEGVPDTDRNESVDFLANTLSDDDFDGQLSPKQKKELEDQFGPKFQAEMQKQFGPDFQKKIQDMFGPKFQAEMQKQFGPDFQKKMQDQFGPKFQKQMEDQFGPKFQKQMEDQFGPKFQEKMEKQFGPEFQEKMEKQFGPEFQEKIEKQFGPEFQMKMEKLGEQMEKEMKNNPSFSPDSMKLNFQMDKLNSGGSKFDPPKFLKSLTEAQKAKQSKQGYLRYDDLTREQKAMFSGMTGSFDIQVKIDGHEAHVRRN